MSDRIRMVDIGVSDAEVNEDDVLEQVPVITGWGRYGEYELVGNGKRTHVSCGKFMSFVGELITVRYEGKRRLYYVTKRGRDVLECFSKARESGLPIVRLNRVIM